jgi:hypothetical protein
MRVEKTPGFAGQLFVDEIGDAVAGGAQLGVAGHETAPPSAPAFAMSYRRKRASMRPPGAADAAGGQRVGAAHLSSRHS